MSLYDKILHERINSEEQLSTAERDLLQDDPAARSLLEENRMLEQSRPKVWAAPPRSQLLRNVYQKAPQGNRLLGMFSSLPGPGRLRSMVGSAAMILVLVSVGVYIERNTLHWQRSDGYIVQYELDGNAGSDLEYFSSQLKGETRQLSSTLFGAGSGNAELLAIEEDAGGRLMATMRLRDVDQADLERFDEAFRQDRPAQLTASSQRSWFSSPRMPGHEFESRLININDRSVRFPEGFSSSELQDLNQLLSTINEDEVYIRGMELGGGRFGLGEVVSLELDDAGNVTILDSALPADDVKTWHYTEIMQEGR